VAGNFRDVEIARTVQADAARLFKCENGVNGRRDDRGDRACGRNLADPQVVMIAEVHVPGAVRDNSDRPGDGGGGGWSGIAGESRGSCSGERDWRLRTGGELQDPAVLSVGDVEISGGIYGDASREVQ